MDIVEIGSLVTLVLVLVGVVGAIARPLIDRSGDGSACLNDATPIACGGESGAGDDDRTASLLDDLILDRAMGKIDEDEFLRLSEKLRRTGSHNAP